MIHDIKMMFYEIKQMIKDKKHMIYEAYKKDTFKNKQMIYNLKDNFTKRLVKLSFLI